MSVEDSQDENVRWEERLHSDLPVENLLRAFAEAGISNADLRSAVSVSPESLRLWAKGGPVRRSNRAVVENIARAMSLLIGDASDSADAVHWLTTARGRLSGSPLELIREQADAILAAAEAHAADRTAEEDEFLAQAGEGHREGRDLAESALLPEPTEGSSTQEKQLLLAHLIQNIATHASARDVMRRLDTLRETGLPNYVAYGKFLDEVRESLGKAGDAPAQVAISSLLTETQVEEEELLKLFRKAGNELIYNHNSILTYSLSMRVIQALWGVEEVKQETCTLYVAEGRVKSVPRSGELSSFADAAEILRFLRSTRYERCIVPDALASSLVAQDRVDLVMLGAQKVFRNGGEITHFVATAGTDAILRAAQASKVPVYVFAEEAKVVEGEPGEPVGGRGFESRERMVPVSLPMTADGSPGGHGRLMMISAELCDVRRGHEDAVAEPIFVGLEGKGSLAAPAAA